MAMASLATSTTAKLFVLGLLCLLLLLPLSLIFGLVQERAGLAHAAEQRIAAGWGREQHLLLPMLRLEYVRDRIDKDGDVHRQRQERWLSLSRASVAATLTVQSRQLGIYSLPIYTAQVRIQGDYGLDALVGQLEESETWQLQRAALMFAPGDLTGLREIRRLTLDGSSLQLRPTPQRLPLDAADAYSYERAQRPVLAGELDPALLQSARTVPLDMDFELAGSRLFNLIPNAADFSLQISGDWPHPGFAGGVLPREREVQAAGFSADWRLLDLSTGMPTVISSSEALQSWGAHAVGVRMVEPGGLYQQNERSAKYGVLLLALTVAALFLTEVLVGVRLHPMHYALVGLALGVFYLLLLALSEHLGFIPAYAIAACTVVAMVGGYCAAVLGAWLRGVLGALVLALLYGFLLVLIRAEELSLLLGAIGITSLLALAMYLTRRFDWYSAGPKSDPPATAT